MSTLLGIDALVTPEDLRSARTRWKTAWKEAYVPGRARSKWVEAHDEGPALPAMVGEGVWERIARARGWVKRDDGRKLIITCPNESRHTSTSDSGTVLYRPSVGDIYGHIHCSHTHCAELDFRTLVTENEWSVALDYVKAFLVQTDESAPIVCTQERNEEADARLIHDLIRDAKGGDSPAGIAANVSAVLVGHSFWKGKLAYDKFRWRYMWTDIPVELKRAHGDDPYLMLSDYTYIQGWLLRGEPRTERPPLSATIETVKMGVAVACQENCIDTLMIHAGSFEKQWDGNPRIDTWLTQYLGCEDTPLMRAIGARWLVAAMARAFEPGCVADMMPILQGKQEAGKGYLLKILFGEEFVTVTEGYKMGSKDFNQKVCDAWIAHDDELVSFNKAGVELVKSWVTQTTSKYRKAYAIDFETIKRRYLPVGSCNPAEYLDDVENRRFWPIHVAKLRAEALIRDRGQLLGEAYWRFRGVYEYRIMSSDPLWGAMKEATQAVRRSNPLSEKVAECIQVGGIKPGCQLYEAFEALGMRPEQFNDPKIIQKVSDALRECGFRSRRAGNRNNRKTVWEPVHWGVGEGDQAGIVPVDN